MEAVTSRSEVGPSRVRVLLVDDEALMRAGLRLMIDGTAGIEVVGEAGDGRVAVSQVAALDPDVVLMDLRMPQMNGIEATQVLRAAGARAAVVVLTAFDADDLLVQALRAGAVSFLLKDSPPEVVVAAVRAAAEGQARFSPSVLDRLVRIAATEAERAPATAPAQSSARPEELTAREWEVGQLLAQGLTNAEIADALYLSVPTVKTHLGRLFDKFGVTNRVQLAIRVLESSGRG